MFKNCLKDSLGSIKRPKGLFFINIAGLAVGMACLISILTLGEKELGSVLVATRF